MQLMTSAHNPDISSSVSPDTEAAALLSRTLAENVSLREQLADIEHQLATFKKLLFGARSEKRPFDIPGQADLFGRPKPDAAAAPTTPVKPHQRGKGKKGFPDGCVNGDGLRFDESVPVTTIRLEPEGIEGLSPDDYEIIGTEKRYKLGQHPSSYHVLCYELPVIKLKSSGEIVPTASVPCVLEGSLADVSFLAGLISDKFVSHLPLYRQHQRLEAGGIHLARSTLTNLVRRSIDLLIPIVEAQSQNILTSSVIAMDETPIKAGKSKTSRKRMNQGYFWPIYGEDGEIVFTFADSRGRHVIERILTKRFKGKILTDGYSAYVAYCKANEDIVHAQCWAHTRRKFVEAREDEPELADRMLDLIGVLYRVESDIREQALEGEAKYERRQKFSVPVVDEITAVAANMRADPGLLPKSPFSKALQYLENRIGPLRVFLDDPAVAVDTNHLERGIRPIAMGRRAWLFCWTELGAEHVGAIQSLISTCRLQGVDPYTYLVDVLQRVSDHPASDVIALTPRVWKTRFADDPLRSALARPG